MLHIKKIFKVDKYSKKKNTTHTHIQTQLKHYIHVPTTQLEKYNSTDIIEAQYILPVSSRKICLSPCPCPLLMWPYLEIGSSSLQLP